MGRVKNHYKTIAGDANTYTTRTTYDLSGKVTKQTYPDLYPVTYAYYPGSGLLKTVTGGSDNKVYATYSGYEPTGKIGQIGHGNGTLSSYTYNPASTRLTGLEIDAPSGLALQKKGYGYSPAGDILEISDLMPGGVTYSYGYDTLHRLQTETNNGQQTPITYTYDAIGNISSKVAGTALAYTPSSTHKHAVGTITVNSTAYTFSYDANGNLYDGYDLTNPAAIAARHITYNADNMPLQITRGGLTTTITYDGNGARAKKVGTNGTTYYIGPHYEIENGVATKYILAGSERIAKVTGTARYYFHKDHLGSTTILTTDAGTVAESTDYLPFGEMRSHSGGTVANYKFTGQELDPETGLYNYNARLYDPVLGKFISADTIVPNFSDPQSLNRYAYCRNNPLIYVDPSGHLFWLDDILIGAAVGALIGGTIEEISGGHFVDGMLPGAISGAFFGAAGGYITGAPAGSLSSITQAGIHAAAGGISGGINAAISGGDIGMGMLIGGVAGGVGKFAGPYLESGGYLAELAGRSAIGGVMGGISAELYGADFGDGFRNGAMTGAVGFVANDWLHESLFPRIHQIVQTASLKWGFGGSLGYASWSWDSSQPTKTQATFTTDLEIGAGFSFTTNLPFDYELPFNINAGLGRWTGVSTNVHTLTVSLGLSAGLLPIDLSMNPNYSGHK